MNKIKKEKFLTEFRDLLDKYEVEITLDCYGGFDSEAKLEFESSDIWIGFDTVSTLSIDKDFLNKKIKGE